MSAYVNTGMVSPMRIAREASATSGAGKGKFLDEFLTWRGVSYAYFYHFPMPASGPTLRQLPAWAQETLGRHAQDARQTISRERLALGQSGDVGWDGMQNYLIETGELHNNARMGWGKAVARWARSPQDAIDLLVELNNRFALDGHAPPSYGGLLGCLGLFEGPKQEGKVLGKVAYKPPKAKYSAMPTRISELRPSSPAFNLFGPKRALVAEASEASPKQAYAEPLAPAPSVASQKRRWAKKLRAYSDGSEDLG